MSSKLLANSCIIWFSFVLCSFPTHYYCKEKTWFILCKAWFKVTFSSYKNTANTLCKTDATLFVTTYKNANSLLLWTLDCLYEITINWSFERWNHDFIVRRTKYEHKVSPLKTGNLFYIYIYMYMKNKTSNYLVLSKYNKIKDSIEVS